MRALTFTFTRLYPLLHLFAEKFECKYSTLHSLILFHRTVSVLITPRNNGQRLSWVPGYLSAGTGIVFPFTLLLSLHPPPCLFTSRELPFEQDDNLYAHLPQRQIVTIPIGHFSRPSQTDVFALLSNVYTQQFCLHPGDISLHVSEISDNDVCQEGRAQTINHSQ